VES
jgi:hypothetical protein